MDEIEMIRAIKAMQTQTILQREALNAMWADTSGPLDTDAEIEDATVTAQNHIDAMQHIINELSPKKHDWNDGTHCRRCGAYRPGTSTGEICPGVPPEKS